MANRAVQWEIEERNAGHARYGYPTRAEWQEATLDRVEPETTESLALKVVLSV